MPFPVAPDVSQFMRPDGSVDQAALFAALQAYNTANPYNPEGDPSLGANVDFGYSGLQDQYGNTGTRHFTPEELAQNGGAPHFFFSDQSPNVWATTDQQEIADRRDDTQTRMQQGAAQIAALIAGGTALTGGFGGGAGAGTGADGLTGVVAGNGNPAAVMLPGAGAGTAGAGVTAASNAAWGSAIPALSQLPSAIATPGAVNALTGTGAVTGANAANGVLDGQGNVIPGTETPNVPNIPSTGGNWLDWLPEITNGINALLGANAANSAADAEAKALQAAIDEQKRQYDTSRADMMPWLTAGQGALGRLQDPNANFLASPDYGFRRDEGTRGIENSFAARGMGQSGNALKALTEFNSNLASGEFGDWWNRQSNLAGIGQTTASNLGQLGQQSAANTGNYLAGQGASRASGIWGRNASLAGGVNDIVGNFLYKRRAG